LIFVRVDALVVIHDSITSHHWCRLNDSDDCVDSVLRSTRLPLDDDDSSYDQWLVALWEQK